MRGAGDGHVAAHHGRLGFPGHSPSRVSVSLPSSSCVPMCSAQATHHIKGGGANSAACVRRSGSSAAVRRCRIFSAVEGSAAKRKVYGGMLQHVKDVEEVVAGLTAQGFSVMRTEGYLDTPGPLAKVATDMPWKAKHGNIDTTFTYKEFLSRGGSSGRRSGTR